MDLARLWRRAKETGYGEYDRAPANMLIMPRIIAHMKRGDVGFTHPDALILDINGRGWINASWRVDESPGEIPLMKIERRTDGFYVWPIGRYLLGVYTSLSYGERDVYVKVVRMYLPLGYGE